MLARSKFLYDHWEPSSSFDSWQHFYEFTHGAGSAHSRRWLWKLAKGAEHVVGMERFCREMRKLKPDVIHFQWLPLPALDRWFLSRLSRIAPLVLTLHNTKFSRFGTSARLQQQTGIRSVFSKFGALIVHSEFSKQKVVESSWASADRVHVVHHGPLEYYRELKMPAAPIAGGEQVVLFFGTTERYKGIDVLLRAFAALPREVLSRTRLLIAGQPRAGVEAAQDLSKQLGVESRVTWDLRFIGEEEVAGLFRSATVVVLPYREIDQSGVLMTAIAFEKAIIATRVGGIPETIQDGDPWIPRPPEDPGQLAKALQEVLTNPQARLVMEGEVRKLRTGALSWKHSARRTLQVYRTVMAPRPPREITESEPALSTCEPADGCRADGEVTTMASPALPRDSYKNAAGKSVFLGGLAAAYAIALGLTIGQASWPLVAVLVALPLAFLWPVQLALGPFVLSVPFESGALTQAGSGRTIGWFVGAAAAGILIATAILGGRLRKPPKAAIWWTVFVVWCLMTSLWALDPQISSDRVMTAAACLVLYLAAACLRVREREFKFIVGAAILAGCIAGLYATFEFYQGMGWRGVRASLMIGRRGSKSQRVRHPPASASGPGGGRLFRVNLRGAQDFDARSQRASHPCDNAHSVAGSSAGGAGDGDGLPGAAGHRSTDPGDTGPVCGHHGVHARPVFLPGGRSHGHRRGRTGRHMARWRGAAEALRRVWRWTGKLSRRLFAIRGLRTAFRGYFRDPHNIYLAVGVEYGIGGLLLFLYVLRLQLWEDGGAATGPRRISGW